jgi:hypothetical protein
LKLKAVVFAGLASVTLALSACAGGVAPSYDGPTGDWDDWDDHVPSYYDTKYCKGGDFDRLPNNKYSCTKNGVRTVYTRPASEVAKAKANAKAKYDAIKKQQAAKKAETAKRESSKTKSGSSWGKSSSSSKSSSRRK